MSQTKNKNVYPNNNIYDTGNNPGEKKRKPKKKELRKKSKSKRIK